MKTLRKKLYVAAGYNTLFFGPGREEFNPKKPMRGFEEYLQEAAEGVCDQLKNATFDEGIIGSFMSGRFIKQANLPAFLPFIIDDLKGKPCTAVEGACGTGGRAIAMAARSILSDLSDATFVTGFEQQNTMKSVYGADVLAGASFYKRDRKEGHAYFFPNIFSMRAGAYYDAFGYETTRQAMAAWYQNAITNARKNPKAQEYHNKAKNLLDLGMTPPNPNAFLPYLNHYDCSKVSDGASALVILSEEGIARSGINKSDTVEIVGIGEAEGDISQSPEDPTVLSTTLIAVNKALEQAGVTIQDIGILEIHDCFTITAILAFEALGLTERGKGAQFILDGNAFAEGKIPTNLSGGLGGFGHPTGATGVRQMVDLLHQLTGRAANPAAIQKPYGMMVSMGGNDKTVTSFVVKRS